ncbi:MAG: hypothetical protein DSY80_06995 [Desulfocapsa sp.]|nr:MAG: hypothetical protein DSY80_06995 [Desulfocapsa sp.]
MVVKITEKPSWRIKYPSGVCNEIVTEEFYTYSCAKERLMDRAAADKRETIYNIIANLASYSSFSWRRDSVYEIMEINYHAESVSEQEV